MAWRFVKQPNGLLARFSEVVDDFTHLDLTEQEAMEISINEYNCGLATAKDKIRMALDDTDPRTRKPAGELFRWNQCLEIIKAIHGKKALNNLLREYEERQSA